MSEEIWKAKNYGPLYRKLEGLAFIINAKDNIPIKAVTYISVETGIIYTRRESEFLELFERWENKS